MIQKKHFQAFFLLAILVLNIAASAVHLYVHHSEDHEHEDECPLCEIVIQAQDIDSSVPDFTFDFEATYAVVFPERKNTYKSPAHTTRTTAVLFGRPPPQG